MIYRFGRHRFDVDAWELRAGGVIVPAEPQVLALLRLLIEHRDRLVSKDEIVEQVWKGRIVSDAAIASRIKSARQVIGDDGEAQAVIRTVPRLGFRFVADVSVEGSAAVVAAAADVAPVEAARRPSIAVLPFLTLGSGGPAALVADALPHDLIAALSRLRWLFVIARGSSFRFRGPGVTAPEVGAALGVRYCLGGTVGFEAERMSITVELADAQSNEVLWAEAFCDRPGAVHEIRERIVTAVVGALELQIPLAEARRARLRSPENLDAWSSYHLGLQQLFRFDREGTARAARLFEQAVAKEPGFARAYAGLSFAHWESAFLGFTDRPAAAASAERCAEQAMAEDPLDPFCNLVRGRVFWLNAELDASLPWLERAIRLNPNYAQAKYSRGWAETLLGQGLEGRASVDQALALSPLDPLAYGMLAVRAFSHLIRDEVPEAAQWAERAARTPGAHALIEMIAAAAHALNGDQARAAFWLSSARRRSPGLDRRAFLQAFPFRDPSGRIFSALDRLGV